MSIQSGNNCEPYLFFCFLELGENLYIFGKLLPPSPVNHSFGKYMSQQAFTNRNLCTCSFLCNGDILTLLSNSSYSVILDIQTLFQSPLQMTLQFMSMRYGSVLYVVLIRYLYSTTPGILLEKNLQHQNRSFYNN